MDPRLCIKRKNLERNVWKKIIFPNVRGGHGPPGSTCSSVLVYDVPSEARVRVASFHLEGTAKKWWMRLKSQFEHEGRLLGWITFEHAFLEQWGSSHMASPQG